MPARPTGWSGCGDRSWTKRRPPTRPALADFLIVAVGRLGHGPEAALFARYVDRLRPKPRLVELADGRGSPAEIKRREAAAMLAKLPPDALAVALDLGGMALGSEALAVRLTGWLESGRPLCFLIGGAEGLDTTVIARADFTLSLGTLTWPHLLARVMLAEQLYRARAIAAGHPYHRGGR